MIFTGRDVTAGGHWDILGCEHCGHEQQYEKNTVDIPRVKCDRCGRTQDERRRTRSDAPQC